MPAHMNNEMWAYLGLSMESGCGRSTNTTSFLLQAPPVLDNEWTNACPPRPDTIPALIHYPQVTVKARYLIDCCVAPVYQLTRIISGTAHWRSSIITVQYSGIRRGSWNTPQ
jgi:hypothetical protein